MSLVVSRNESGSLDSDDIIQSRTGIDLPVNKLALKPFDRFTRKIRRLSVNSPVLTSIHPFTTSLAVLLSDMNVKIDSAP